MEMRAWARMVDIRLQQDRRHRPRLPLLRRPQGAERLQRPEDDASQDREGVEQGAQRRPEAYRRDRQLQQARLVEVQGGPRVVRPRSEPSAQGQGGPGPPVLLGSQGARRLQRPGHHASRRPYCSGRKRPERPIRLDQPSAPRRGRNGGRRFLLPIGVILRILDWAAMRGGYEGCIVFDGWIYVCVDADAKNRPIGKRVPMGRFW